MEASGHARWLERLLAELQIELWIGDAAEIRVKRVRKQKTDRQDAHLILRLLLEDRFPRIWVPSWENRDLPTTAVAPAPHGAGAHPHHESVAGGGAQRRPALQEAACGEKADAGNWNHSSWHCGANRRRRDLLELPVFEQTQILAFLQMFVEFFSDRDEGPIRGYESARRIRSREMLR